jgi:hypothetical protein
VDTVARSAAAAERQLDHLIERRSRKGETTLEDEEHLWQTSVQRHAAMLRDAARAEWTLYHEHMSVLHLRLSQEHAQKAEKLMQDGPNGEDRGEGHR